MSLPETPCYLNGSFTRLCDAKVSVLDRGFLFGDGAYEVIPVYGGRFFRFDEHMARLDRSLAKLRIANPHEPARWLALMRELSRQHADQTGQTDQLLYLQITRGVAPRQHGMPTGLAPTVFMMTNALEPVPPEQRRQGVACVTARDFRWERCDIKSISLLGNVLARQIAADHGAAETILLRDGHLTEASSSNVWVVHEGAVLGPPKSEHVLEGIRYDLVAELCEELGIGFNLRPISETELMTADEVLLTSASREVLPVTRIDGEPVGHGAGKGRPGPIYGRLYEAYQRAKLEQSL
jgi:D-alanine transaminase